MPGIRDDWAREASFIFSGTVQRLGAATLEGVPVNDRTAVVRVDSILEAPAELRHSEGQQITVQMDGGAAVRRGQRAVFYTNALIFGASLAVQSIGHEAVSAKTTAATDPVEARAQRRLRRHFGEADLVITGRVRSVRLPAGAPRTLTEGARPAEQVISEHDPAWRVAHVEVDQVHKGAHGGETVEVGFPSSTDVRWFGAPKLHPGEEGYFLLHREPAIREAPGADLGDYLVLHPDDFQPRERPGGIKNLITTPEAQPR